MLLRYFKGAAILPHWTEYPSAPVSGSVVTHISTLSQGANTLHVKSHKGNFPLIVLLTDKQITGYVNACPHQYLPLDYRSNIILNASGDKLMCSAHGAMFDSKSGAGLNDIAQGCHLDAVPLTVTEDGTISIG